MTLVLSASGGAKLRSFDTTTRPTTDSHRLPLCRLCWKLISEFKMPDRRRIGLRPATTYYLGNSWVRRLREVDYFADSWALVSMDIAEKVRADNPETAARQAA